jgi:hypothetical protein
LLSGASFDVGTKPSLLKIDIHGEVFIIRRLLNISLVEIRTLMFGRETGCSRRQQ